MSASGHQSDSVLVTGAASGIGRATTELLLDKGHQVVALDRDERHLDDLSRSRSGDRLWTITADLGDASGCAHAIDCVEGLGTRVLGLVNSAGIGSARPLLDTDYESSRAVLAVNVLGMMAMIRGTLPGMLAAGRGAIVNVSSVAAQLGGGVFGDTVYAASKGAVLALTRGVAREFGPQGIRCNSVAPGPIVTPMTEESIKTHGERAAGMVPLGRLGSAPEVASVIAFLLSEDAAYVSGATVNVDGALVRP